jgi:hypothetical protein
VTRPRRTTWTRLAALAVIVALAVLCLGLPRMLVVCTGPHCDGRIQLAHAQGSCCDHEHDDAAPSDGPDGDEPGAPCCDDDGRCIDLALAIGIGPLPERTGIDREAPPRVQAEPPALPRLPAAALAVLRPHATGPPRADRRTALLASTILLL